MKPVVKIAMASLKSVPGQVILNLSKGSLTLQTEIIKSGKFLGRYCSFALFSIIYRFIRPRSFNYDINLRFFRFTYFGRGICRFEDKDEYKYEI